MSEQPLAGCVAVVSGGAGRLGPVMVRALTGAGAHVVATGRHLDRLEAEFGGEDRVQPEVCDVATDDWPDLVTRVGEQHGRLDILVNNAHVGAGGSLRLAKRDDFRTGYELAVTAPALAINAARPWLARSAAEGGPASIVNVSSMYGVVSPVPALYDSEEGRNPPAYGAAKAAMLQLTRYAAVELGADGIRVNSLVLGPFPGDGVDPEFAARLGSRTALGRVGQPAEVGQPLLFLCLPGASFVTGSTVTVDGGWTAM